jgi:hypothetical protein
MAVHMQNLIGKRRLKFKGLIMLHAWEMRRVLCGIFYHNFIFPQIRLSVGRGSDLHLCGRRPSDFNIARMQLEGSKESSNGFLHHNMYTWYRGVDRRSGASFRLFNFIGDMHSWQAVFMFHLHYATPTSISPNIQNFAISLIYYQLRLLAISSIPHFVNSSVNPLTSFSSCCVRLSAVIAPVIYVFGLSSTPGRNQGLSPCIRARVAITSGFNSSPSLWPALRAGNFRKIRTFWNFPARPSEMSKNK